MSEADDGKHLSSHQVFDFFIRERNGKKDGSGILSSACFHMWCEARAGKLKHPEESFRRTLVSHLRGTDRRKPFDPDVEESLLKILREPIKDNGKCVWESVLGPKGAHIGKRKFKQYGFHESKRLGVDISCQKRKKRCSNSNRNDDVIDQEEKSFASDAGESRPSQSSLARLSDFVISKQLIDTEFWRQETLNSAAQLFVMRDNAVANYHKDSPARYVLETFTNYIQMEEIVEYTRESIQAGCIISPALCYIMNFAWESGDFKLTKEFVEVPEELRFFSKQKTVGTFYFKCNDYFVDNADEGAREILGYDVKGMFAMNLWPSMIHGLYIMCLARRKLDVSNPVKVKEVWQNTLFFRADGKAAFVRARFSLDPSRAGVICEFQDIIETADFRTMSFCQNPSSSF